MIMSRFLQEITGTLDAQVAERTHTENKHYWENSAKAEVARCIADADSNAIVEADGAIKWKSNSRYLMDDFCEKLEYASYNFSRTATQYKREAQVAEEIRAYKEAQKNHKPSAEELYEMRSAFGAGAEVVDIISGKRIQL